MTAKELQKAQNEISDAIYAHAKSLGFDENVIKPITDGVSDIGGYLKSNPKVMWVLKEPNGQKEDGSLEYGDWSIAKQGFKDLDAVAKVNTWQPMIYVMYGYLHGLYYDDMNYIRDDHNMAKVMRQIAYLNASKMPGYNRSYTKDIEHYYHQWKPILDRQLDLYAPDVIIFGNTFAHFKKDFEEKGLEKKYTFPGWIDIYKSNNCLLFDAYHPSRKGKEYVDTLIEALNKYYPIKNKR